MSTPLTIEINTKEFESFQFWVEEMQKRLNLANQAQQDKLRERLEKVMAEDLAKRFASSPSTVAGGNVHGGEYWKPLSESYLAARPDRAQGKIYIDTQSFLRSFQVGNPQNISRFTDQLTYEFGSNLEYASKLQSMRQVVFFYDELLDSLALQFLEWLVELPENNNTKLTEADNKNINEKSSS